MAQRMAATSAEEYAPRPTVKALTVPGLQLPLVAEPVAVDKTPRFTAIQIASAMLVKLG